MRKSQYSLSVVLQANLGKRLCMQSKRYVVWGAPPALVDTKADVPYRWHTVSTAKSQAASSSGSWAPVSPPSNLEAASRRISVLYENIIFGDDSEEEGGEEDGAEDHSEALRKDQTTAHTFAPTPHEPSVWPEGNTFLRASPSRLQSIDDSQFKTQGVSYDTLDASSITCFPDFHFSLHSVTPLSSLSGSKKGFRKVSVLLAVLEVDGPDAITLKKGLEAGKEIYVLKMILGDEDGVVCKLTAWRDVAETWGGAGQATGIKRGDVVYLENVTAAWELQMPVVLTASPNLKSKAEICYRTMPRTASSQDYRLRPDLRLGYNDAAVRRVADIVQWFEKIAGLS